MLHIIGCTRRVGQGRIDEAGDKTEEDKAAVPRLWCQSCSAKAAVSRFKVAVREAAALMLLCRGCTDEASIPSLLHRGCCCKAAVPRPPARCQGCSAKVAVRDAAAWKLLFRGCCDETNMPSLLFDPLCKAAVPRLQVRQLCRCYKADLPRLFCRRSCFMLLCRFCCIDAAVARQPCHGSMPMLLY